MELIDEMIDTGMLIISAGDMFIDRCKRAQLAIEAVSEFGSQPDMQTLAINNPEALCVFKIV